MLLEISIITFSLILVFFFSFLTVLFIESKRRNRFFEVKRNKFDLLLIDVQTIFLHYLGKLNLTRHLTQQYGLDDIDKKSVQKHLKVLKDKKSNYKT